MKAGLTRVMDGDEKSKEREEDEEEGYRKKRICSAPEEGRNRGNRRQRDLHLAVGTKGGCSIDETTTGGKREKKSKIEECVT